jgi:hypothetical protein
MGSYSLCFVRWKVGGRHQGSGGRLRFGNTIHIDYLPKHEVGAVRRIDIGLEVKDIASACKPFGLGVFTLTIGGRESWAEVVVHVDVVIARK